MKVKEIIKKQTVIVAIAVILVVVVALGVSYSIFFDIRGNDENQVITAGTLDLTVTDSSGSTLTPLSITSAVDNSTGLSSTPLSYTVKHNSDSNLPASYTVYLYAESDNQIDLSLIEVSTDGSSSAGSTYKAMTSLTSTTIDGTTYYQIDSGTLAVGSSSSTKYLRLWIDEDKVTSDIVSQTLKIGMYIVSEVNES